MPEDRRPWERLQKEGLSPVRAEGGETRNHEAEVETVARALEPHMSGGPMTLKRASNAAIAALDAVRRPPQGEDHEAAINRILWNHLRGMLSDVQIVSIAAEIADLSRVSGGRDGA